MKDEQLDSALDAWAEGRVGDEVSEDEASALVARAKGGRGRGREVAAVGIGLTLAAALMLIAAGFVGLGAWLYVGQESAPGIEDRVATGESLAVEVLVAEGAASAEDGLTLAGEGALVATVGEDRIGLGADSAVALEGTRTDLVLVLERGQVAVQAGSRTEEGSLVVRAGEVTVGVIGTRFAVAHLEDGVRVEVAEGRVSVERQGGLVEVSAGMFVELRSGELTHGQTDGAQVDGLLRLVVEEDAPEPAAVPAPAAPAWDPSEARQRVLARDPTIRAELEARVAGHPEDGDSWALLATVQLGADERSEAAASFGRAADHTEGAPSARHRFRQAELVEAEDPAAASDLFARAAVPEAGALLPDALLGQGRAAMASGDLGGRAVLERVVAEHPTSAAAIKARALLAEP